MERDRQILLKIVALQLYSCYMKRYQNEASYKLQAVDKLSNW
jgi:hypothetical protein